MRLISALFLLIPLLAFAAPNMDIRLKVALSYNFAKFTQWPDSLATNELTFCYFDKSFTEAFSQLKGKRVAKKQIKTHQLDNSDELNTCQVLYLSTNDQPVLVNTLLAVKNLPVLTVSDQPGFIASGGMIEFTAVNNKMRFKINNVGIKQGGLSLSSKVLKMAVEVRH